MRLHSGWKSPAKAAEGSETEAEADQPDWPDLHPVRQAEPLFGEESCLIKPNSPGRKGSFVEMRGPNLHLNRAVEGLQEETEACGCQ